MKCAITAWIISSPVSTELIVYTKITKLPSTCQTCCLISLGGNRTAGQILHSNDWSKNNVPARTLPACTMTFLYVSTNDMNVHHDVCVCLPMIWIYCCIEGWSSLHQGPLVSVWWIHGAVFMDVINPTSERSYKCYTCTSLYPYKQLKFGVGGGYTGVTLFIGPKTWFVQSMSITLMNRFH